MTAATDVSPPTSSAALRSPSSTTPQTEQVLPQQLKSQQGSVVCENGVCRLRLVTSNKHYHEVVQPFATPQAPGVTINVASTTVRDAKSVRTVY